MNGNTKVAASPGSAKLAYRIAALLGAAYAIYVIVLKLLKNPSGGPLGEVGEFLLMLICITTFAIGLFIDEAHQRSPDKSP